MPIPGPERFIARQLLNRWCRKHPPDVTASLVREQNRVLMRSFEAAAGRETQLVQIKRIPGLEPVSTNYSLAMVAEHLALVNTGLAGLIADLAAGRTSDTIVDPADSKPSPEAQPGAAVAGLELSVGVLDEALADIDAVKASESEHEHPWCGSLPCRVWACFPTFHNTVHLKQAEKIVAGLPVV